MDSVANQRSRVGAGLFFAFLLLTVLVVAGWTQAIDDVWRDFMTANETSWLVSVAEVLHRLGGVPIALATSVVIAVAFMVMRKWWAVAAWVTIVAGAQVLSTITKILVDRQRPIDGLVHESSASYPSGHAMVSGAAIAIGFAVIAGIIWPRRYRLFLGLGITYAVVMAWSRTYLRAHWLSDVVGGLFFGTAIVALVAGMLARHIRDD